MMPRLLPHALTSLLFVASLASAQSATTKPAQTSIQTPTPQLLSPKAAYADAMHPLNSTRNSISNWSDTETAALKVTITHAAVDCHARDPKDYAGEDLIDLTRLCALGQAYSEVAVAATRYLGSDGPKPHMAQAYAALIDADLRIKDEAAAMKAAQTMLVSVPYSELVAGAVDEVINYKEFLDTKDALALAGQRQPLLLAQMRALAAPAITPPSSADGDNAPQTLHELYADGLSFAALQQLNNTPTRDEVATSIVADLDRALPETLAPDDALPIATLRRRYSLLGKPLPTIAGVRYLRDNDPFPNLPAVNAITALLVFPDWCAQCIRMALHLPESVFTVSKHEAYLYGVLAETVPPEKPEPPSATKSPSPFTPAQAANLLNETPTVATTPIVLDQFAITDVPFLVLTDANGILRVLQPVDESAILPGNTIDSAISHIGDQWPVTPKAQVPAVKPPATHRPAH